MGGLRNPCYSVSREFVELLCVACIGTQPSRCTITVLYSSELHRVVVT